MKRTLTTLAVGALAVGGSIVATQPVHAATSTTYSVMLLQPQGGDVNSFARGLNNRGDVVGSTTGSIPAQGPVLSLGERTTVWKARSGIGDRGAGGAFDYTGLDISGAGDVIEHFPNNSQITWRARGSEEKLPVGNAIRAHHISENGVLPIVVGDGGAPYVATSPTDWKELPLPEGTSNANVTGISQDGRRVAGYADYGSITVPVVWNDHVPTRLQSPAGSTFTSLAAINSSGVSAGCASINGSQRPYRYSALGAPTALPILAGYTHSCADVINDAGVIAGTATKGDTSTAVVWVNGQARDLNTLVAQRSGYTLNGVADINASGQIVGTATLTDGTTRGYIATPSTAETIYTSPGYHNFNGRQWKTTCEPYSKTTRCRTEIWASTVTTANGRHSVVNGWAFNNLTYLPSDRALWKNNPLGNTGTWTATDGRAWRTECDTAATGRNGCRSYSRVTVVEAVPKPTGGYTFRQENKFVFNNIVKFTTK